MKEAHAVELNNSLVLLLHLREYTAEDLRIPTAYQVLAWGRWTKLVVVRTVKDSHCYLLPQGLARQSEYTLAVAVVDFVLEASEVDDAEDRKGVAESAH